MTRRARAIEEALRGFLNMHHAAEVRAATESLQEGTVECDCELCVAGRAALATYYTVKRRRP